MVEGYRSVQAIVASQLRKDIVDGVFRPGTHLPERELTERYEVSRGPIREVLRSLEVQGLVTRTRSKGVRVCELSVAEMRELYEMRVEMEALAARKAVELADDQGVEEVRAAYDRLLAVDHDSAEWLVLNNEFHCALYRLGQRHQLVGLICQLMERVQPYMRLYLESADRVIHSAEEHEVIWQALVDRDVDRCESVTRAHLKTAGLWMEEMLRKAAGGVTSDHVVESLGAESSVNEPTKDRDHRAQSKHRPVRDGDLPGSSVRASPTEDLELVTGKHRVVDVPIEA